MPVLAAVINASVIRCSDAQTARRALSTVICRDFNDENFADGRLLLACDFADALAPCFAFFAAIDFLEAALRDPDACACFLPKPLELFTSAIV